MKHNKAAQAGMLPTLTEIVEAQHQMQALGDTELSLPLEATNTAPTEGKVEAAAAPLSPAAVALYDALAEQMVHRVIQRVDGLLAQRIGEVIATVIEAQTRSLLPSIREELEFAVRTSVYEAMAEELSEISPASDAGI